MSDKFQNKYRIPSARATWWNYGRNAAYFVTICTQDRECYFGDIIVKQFIASSIGEIAQTCWYEIPQHFPYVQLDAFVMMPNHVHGIIVIDKQDEIIVENEMAMNKTTTDVPFENSTNDHVETLHATSLPHTTFSHTNPEIISLPSIPSPPVKNEHMASISPKYGTLGSIVRSYKSAVSKHAHKFNPGFEWQERFYDSIILNEKSYQFISEYIINNQSKWNDDKFYIE